MAFLAPELQVALLTVHLPLREALDGITGPTRSPRPSIASIATPEDGSRSPA